MARRGRFITLEGGEGVGKSTQVKALEAALAERGIDVVVTREPGGSPGAERIRELLLTGDDDRWGPAAEALLFAAARADHVDRLIGPALAAGTWVVCDRFFDSSVAYQGGAGGLGLDAVRALNAFACGDVVPDRTLLLVVAEGAERARARDRDGSDRIGGRTGGYHERVDRAFRQLAEAEPKRIRAVDASGTPGAVTERLIRELADLLP